MQLHQSNVFLFWEFLFIGEGTLLLLCTVITYSSAFNIQYFGHLSLIIVIHIHVPPKTYPLAWCQDYISHLNWVNNQVGLKQEIPWEKHLSTRKQILARLMWAPCKSWSYCGEMIKQSALDTWSWPLSHGGCIFTQFQELKDTKLGCNEDGIYWKFPFIM